MRIFCALAILAVLFLPVRGQSLPAFPGADGAAGNVSGGRGGIVYHVTKLNSAIDDPARNDPGTLRYGLTNSNFPAGVPRTIVFDVGGVFHLGRLPQAGWDPNGNGWDAQSRLTIGGTNITLAGQTAPGSGVIFMGGGLKPQGNNNIIRNITVASGYGMRNWWNPGQAFPTKPVVGDVGVGNFPDATVFDAMDIAGTNIMIDHVSTLYATDETISMNEVANNITVQYSNISQGQNYPQWDAEGAGRYTGHALGSLLAAAPGANISFHHNLYAHQKSRLPQTGGSASYDFRNNVFYNWLGTAGARNNSTTWNLVGNFYLAGDGGDDPIGGSNPGITTVGGGTGVIGTNANIYRTGNMLDSNKDADANDGVLLSTAGAASPFWAGGVVTYRGTTDTAVNAFERVLNYVGANWWTRDDVIDTPDERIIHEARTGTGKIMAWADDPWNNDPNEGTEWRALKNTPQTTRDANWDTEASVGYGVGDGMPTYWELEHGLDPNVRDDTGDFDNDGYTNLEEYLNDIAAWPAPGPLVFDATTNNRYAVITNWDSNPDPALDLPWQPSRYDVAHINAGTAVVDAVGQHAGTLVVAANVGDEAALDITEGWLKAAEGVVLGAEPGATGSLDLSGGRLFASVLEKNSESQFSFTGGTLSADLVTFSLLNQGGIIAPGNGVGVTLISGDLAFESGSVQIEIAGNQLGQYDAVLVEGLLSAGGTLEVILDGYAPVAGDNFSIFAFGSAAGEFHFALPTLAGDLEWDTTTLLTNGVLSVVAGGIANADFDGDGDVDGRDFLVWQRGESPNPFSAEDLALWQAEFGASELASSVAVPEPGALVVILIGIMSLVVRRPA